MLQCGQSTRLLIAHCGPSARLGQPAVQHELVLDVNEKEALKCQCCTSWDCHSADYLSKHNRPKTWKSSCGPTVHTAVYLHLPEGKDSSTSFSRSAKSKRLKGDGAQKHGVWLQGGPARVSGLFSPDWVWFLIFKHFLSLQ